MAPHSSTLAWKIPWTEEPGGLQSMGSLGVGHNWATSLSVFTFMHWRRKWQPTSVFLPGKSQEGGAWWAAVYGVAQSWTRLKRLSSSSSSRRAWVFDLLWTKSLALSSPLSTRSLSSCKTVSLLTSLWFTLLCQPITIFGFPYLFWVPFPHCWWCFPGGLDGKESACNARDLGSDPWIGKISWRRERLPTLVSWLREFHGLPSMGSQRVAHNWVTFSLCDFQSFLNDATFM